MGKIPEELDDVSRKILKLLQENGRTSHADIARALGMAPSAILERVRRLEERGVLLGYEARVEPRALGLGLCAYVFIRVDEPGGAAKPARRLAELPEVQEVHSVAGEDCILIKVRADDTAALGELLSTRICRVPGVQSTRTTIVLQTFKETGRLPIPEVADAQ